MTKSNALKQLEAIKNNPWKRLFMPTPDFFKKVRMVCVYLGLVTGSFSAWLLKTNPESKIAIICGSFSLFMTTVAPTILSWPVDEDKALSQLNATKGDGNAN